MSENLELHRQIIAAGRQAGLFLNDDKMLGQNQLQEEDRLALLTKPVIFTLRPVEEYLRHYRGSWTQMKLEAVAVGEMGDDDLGVALVFETHFRLAYVEGDSSDDPGLVLDDILVRIEDFVESYPAEATMLFTDSFSWEMSIQGEIIYEAGEYDRPILDFGMYPELGLNVLVYETATETGFENALATLGDDSAMTLAIQEMMQRLTLLFRWLDTEMPSRPPLLDLL